MIDSMAKQKFNRLINHNVILVTMVVISCLQVYNYIRLNKPSCILIFFIAFVLSYQAVSKNMTISLFLAIFIANFLLGCASFVEGHTVMVHTPFPHEHGDPTDKRFIPGFDEDTTEGGSSMPNKRIPINPSSVSAADDENMKADMPEKEMKADMPEKEMKADMPEKEMKADMQEQEMGADMPEKEMEEFENIEESFLNRSNFGGWLNKSRYQ